MPNRAGDWLAQALRDLEHAQLSRDNEQHEWACFAAHQAAEKAVKALHLSQGQEAWGHSVVRLLSDLPSTVATPGDLIEQARVLDGYYIPTRYPNGHPEGAPLDHYGPLHSEGAITYARAIVGFADSQMA